MNLSPAKPKPINIVYAFSISEIFVQTKMIKKDHKVSKARTTAQARATVGIDSASFVGLDIAVERLEITY